MTKPFLRRQCPLCGGPMQWCGDVSTEVNQVHDCHQITCVKCEYNIDFNGKELFNADTLEEAQTIVADKWNKSL